MPRRSVPLAVIVLAVVVASLAGACGTGAVAQSADPTAGRRRAMVGRQIEGRGIRDGRVLDAMRRVPRHRFVPEDLQSSAYDDSPLPIGFGQTISQPYIVGYMSELLRIEPQHRVLEIGTGSGYQAAILGELAREVYTIEIVPELGRQAETVLRALGYRNVHVRVGDGYAGWPDRQPFDRILLTAAPERIPQPLIDQLGVDGRLVAPVGGVEQWIKVLTRTPERLVEETTIEVRFVPFVRK